MTHSGIYKKFMIEYDKADITSSYPSLTDYEIATLLDKAYLAVIAQKLTGNNQRKIGFEGDIKAIEDIRPLITTKRISVDPEYYQPGTLSLNEVVFKTPIDQLYYVLSQLEYTEDGVTTQQTTVIVNHEDSQKFKCTSTNMPWINNPVVYIESDYIHVLYDYYKYIDSEFKLVETYVMKPESFVANVNNKNTKFECSDNVAEEIINQAILFAAETVESQRLQTKSNILSLEA